MQDKDADAEEAQRLGRLHSISCCPLPATLGDVTPDDCVCPRTAEPSECARAADIEEILWPGQKYAETIRVQTIPPFDVKGVLKTKAK